MNAKLWACVIAGVLIAHLAVLVIVDKFRTMGAPQPKLVEPTFSTVTTTFRDLDGKTLQVVHEFTVQTEMAEKSVLEKLPKPPTADSGAQQAEPAPSAAN
ncbi:MAG: hypothetical protein ABI318_14755 [Chthoniobacteraceae bacterium]